jgi:putative transposase
VQQAMLNRTFGCVRVVWNRALAGRQARWRHDHQATTYAQTDAGLTALKKDPQLAWLNEVSCVPLQQALRHQHRALRAFFAKRARYPRFKTRRVRHDRDLNAARNILAAGLAAARGFPGDACGADVRHPETPPVQSAVNQEPQPVTAGTPVPQDGE